MLLEWSLLHVKCHSIFKLELFGLSVYIEYCTVWFTKTWQVGQPKTCYKPKIKTFCLHFCWKCNHILHNCCHFKTIIGTQTVMQCAMWQDTETWLDRTGETRLVHAIHQTLPSYSEKNSWTWGMPSDTPAQLLCTAMASPLLLMSLWSHLGV